MVTLLRICGDAKRSYGTMSPRLANIYSLPSVSLDAALHAKVAWFCSHVFGEASSRWSKLKIDGPAMIDICGGSILGRVGMAQK